jgi:hypothetical protein
MLMNQPGMRREKSYDIPITIIDLPLFSYHHLISPSHTQTRYSSIMQSLNSGSKARFNRDHRPQARKPQIIKLKGSGKPSFTSRADVVDVRCPFPLSNIQHYSYILDPQLNLLRYKSG